MSDLVKLLRESFVAYSPKGRKVRSFRLLEDILPGDRERIADELERFEQENADLRAKLEATEQNVCELKCQIESNREECCACSKHKERLQAERDEAKQQVKEIIVELEEITDINEQARKIKQQEEAISILKNALEEICNPITYMQKEAEEKELLLDGCMALVLSKDPNYLKSIAKMP